MIIPLELALPRLHLESESSSDSRNSRQTQTGAGLKERYEEAKGLQDLLYGERVKEASLFSLEKGKLRKTRKTLMPVLKSSHEEDTASLFTTHRAIQGRQRATGTSLST